MPIPLYSIKNLHIKNGKSERLQIKQFDIHRGACYVFDGRMGSGKTTFIDILYSRRNIGKGEILFESSGVEVLTTNNRMELEGAIKGLEGIISYHDENNVFLGYKSL